MTSSSVMAGSEISKDVDELLGICKEIMADGKVNQEEADFLVDWLYGARDLTYTYPYSVLMPKISVMLEDDIIDKSELEELTGLLQQIKTNVN